MKKLALVLAAILVVAAIVLPPTLGVIAEQRYTDLLTELTGQLEPTGIVTEFYQRGWLTSSARHRIPVRKEGEASVSHKSSPAIVIDSTIFHGPLALAAESQWMTPMAGRMRSTLVWENGGSQRQLRGIIETDIDLGGGGRMRYRAEPHEETLPSGTLLRWNGGQVTLKFDASRNRLRASGNIGRVQLTSSAQQLELGPIGLNSTLTRSEVGFWTGSVAVDIDAIEPQPTTTQQMQLAGLSFRTILSTREEGVNLDIRASAKSVRAGDWAGADAIAHLRAAQFDVKAFKAFLATRPARVVSVSSKAWTIDAPAALAELKPLLKHGGTVELKKLNVPTPYGNVSATAKVAFQPQPKTGAQSDSLAALQADFNLRLPRSIADRAAREQSGVSEAVGNLINYGLLRPSGDDYIVAASYANGLLTVNGATLPMPPRRGLPANAASIPDQDNLTPSAQ